MSDEPITKTADDEEAGTGAVESEAPAEEAAPEGDQDEAPVAAAE